MPNYRSISASLILSTALVLGACKGKDEAAIDTSAPAKALKSASIGKSDVSALFDVDKRKVPNAEAEAALDALGLSDSNNRGLTWDKRSGDNGTYTFADMAMTDDDGNLTIKKMTLSGVRMEGEDATFDLMTAEGVNTEHKDGTMRVDNLSLARPSPALAAAITEAIEQMRDVKDLGDINLDIELEDEDIYFGALALSGVTMQGDEATATLESLAWGETEDSGEGLFQLKDLKVKGRSDGKSDVEIDMKLGAINATGLNMDYYRMMSGGKTRRKANFQQVFGGMTPYDKTFDAVSFSDLDIKMNTLHITSDGGQGRSKTKGDLIVTEQVLEPLVIKFTGEPTERNFRELKKNLDSLGYDEIVITSSQKSSLNTKTDTVKVYDSFVELKDGFRMGFAYEGGGINAIQARLAEAQQNDETVSDREMERLADNISLKSFDLALTDQSIMERGFKLAAEKQGSSPKMLRMQAKSMMMLMGMGAKNEAQGAMVTELSSAMGDFIDNGGTLRLSLNPSEPLTVRQLKRLDTGDMGVEALGFSATTD